MQTLRNAVAINIDDVHDVRTIKKEESAIIRQSY